MPDNTDHDYLPDAVALLDTIKSHKFPSRPSYLHPYTLLTALLTHAPTKHEIAKDIIDNAADDLVGGLCRLTDYFWTTLLVPCTSSLFLMGVDEK
jgi:hypothetical protein